MTRLTPYLGLLLALIVGAFVYVFSSTVPVVYAPAAASSTPPVLEPEPASATTAPATTTPPAATSTPKLAPKAPVKAAKAPIPQSPTPVASTTPVSAPIQAPAPLTSSGNVPLDTAASTLRSALVNIICYAPVGSSLHSISGSGIFIDSKGIILTNAHVAQYFLLADKGVDCTIRSGSPAVDKYEAALIYISPSWIRTNPTTLSQAQATGTGEYDFAFLAVTRGVTSSTLPSSFPSIPLAQLPPAALAPIVIASYGAQFLETSQVQSALFPTIVFGSVKDVFTFDTNSIDVLALGGSAAAQEGSSGGGVADASGMLVGTITTSTVQGSTDTRSLTAITASYIRAEYAREMNSTLDSLLSESTDYAVSDFAPQIPKLEAIITANL